MMGRILLVEDNTALAEGLAYNLRHEGHDVRIAEDGESGLADAREWSPDLVILDLMLPRLDGYGVLAAIREHFRREDPGHEEIDRVTDEVLIRCFEIRGRNTDNKVRTAVEQDSASDDRWILTEAPLPESVA